MDYTIRPLFFHFVNTTISIAKSFSNVWPFYLSFSVLSIWTQLISILNLVFPVYAAAAAAASTGSA
jgi:hypothetical protein